MFGIGTLEIVVIALVILLIYGPDRLPELARSLARMVYGFKNTVDEIKHEFADAEKRIDDSIKPATHLAPAENADER